MAVAPQRRGRAKDPTALTIPSLVTAFLGGLLVLGGRDYFVATGLLLVAAATLMVFKRTAVSSRLGLFGPSQPPSWEPEQDLSPG